MLDIKNNIARERIKRGLTQRKLAAMAGISQSCLANIECGQREPRIYTLIKIANALNVKLSDLILVTENGFNVTYKYF